MNEENATKLAISPIRIFIGAAIAVGLVLPNLSAGNYLFATPLTLLALAAVMGVKNSVLSVLGVIVGAFFIALVIFLLVLMVTFIAYSLTGEPRVLWLLLLVPVFFLYRHARDGRSHTYAPEEELK